MIFNSVPLKLLSFLCVSVHAVYKCVCARCVPFDVMWVNFFTSFFFLFCSFLFLLYEVKFFLFLHPFFSLVARCVLQYYFLSHFSLSTTSRWCVHNSFFFFFALFLTHFSYCASKYSQQKLHFFLFYFVWVLCWWHVLIPSYAFVRLYIYEFLCCLHISICQTMLMKIRFFAFRLFFSHTTSVIWEFQLNYKRVELRHMS